VFNPSITPSILIPGDIPNTTLCHCMVQDGKIVYLPESTHGLAGKVVDMEVIQ
jgi:hypothetical protein